MTNKRKIGEAKETIAAQYLEQNGYLILDRNFYCRSGEIDIIAREQEYLVFVEVRFRSGSNQGFPEESIRPVKRRHIISAAKYYMYQKQMPEDIPVRFDVVAILGNRIRLIKNAFQTG